MVKTILFGNIILGSPVLAYQIGVSRCTRITEEDYYYDVRFLDSSTTFVYKEDIISVIEE